MKKLAFNVSLNNHGRLSSEMLKWCSKCAAKKERTNRTMKPLMITVVEGALVREKESNNS